MAEETVILHFEVDQGAAERQLEKVEGLLLDNRKAVQDLQKANKAGTITQEEYVKENIRLQGNIKKEQEQKKALIRTIETESNSRNALKARVSSLTKEYDNLNIKTAQGAKRADELEKELSQLNAQLTKGDKAAGLFKNQIGNYPKVLQDAASNIRVAGVSVGDIGTRLASLANPITAAVGLLGALGSAYAKSTIGAKDLEFAQNQVAAAFTLSSNAFAEFISSAEDGEGIVSKFTNELIARFGGGALANVTKFAANLQEQLEDLGRTEIAVRSEANQLVEQNQDLLERVADDQLTLNQRIEAANTVEVNLKKNKEAVLKVLVDQLIVLTALGKLNKEDEGLQTSIAQKTAEITREGLTQEKQITRINKQQDDLNAKLAEQIRFQQQLFEFDVREANAPPIDLSPAEFDFAGGVDDPLIAASKARQDQFIAELKTVEETEDQKRQKRAQSLEFEKKVDQARIQSAAIVFNALAGLAEENSKEQKVLALIGIGLDTATALTSGIAASQDIPYPGNLVAMATTIATVLANIAAAKKYIEGFEDGGYTGTGKNNDIAGVVHKNEYVAPAYVTSSPAAQPHLAALERMRGGYQDGGFVANQAAAPAQQALIMANALRHLPVPVLSVQEVTTVQTRIRVKENVSTLSR
jgi:hypothetical protein